MLSDDTASSRIYFVINNIHCLPQDSESTKRLLDLIKGDIAAANDQSISRVSTRWMLTSRRSNKSISDIVAMPDVRLIDLEDDQYANQVQRELRKHAQTKVAMLGSEKKYKKDLMYFVSSLIGNRANNTGWIDMTIRQLEELPESENPLRIRQILKKLPQELDDLLNEAWGQVFESNPTHAEKIQDMLQALVLTYQDPNLDELAVLAGFQADEQGTEELRYLIGRCKPFLTLSEAEVGFKSPIVKPHLLRHAKELLNVSEEEIKWLHGELALRSFAHLVERFDVPDPEEKPPDSIPAVAPSTDGDDDENKVKEDDHDENNNQDDDSSEGGDDDDDDDDGDNDDAESVMEEPAVSALPYIVRFWLQHASESTEDMAINLSLEESFWSPQSRIRSRWIYQYEYLTQTFDKVNPKNGVLHALHIAASIGFRNLVTALINNGYANELDVVNDWANTPVSVQSYVSAQKLR